MGCASGKNAGPRNIFGNKYGQNLAAVQIAREKRLEAKRQREEDEAAATAAKQREVNNGENLEHDEDDEASTDDDSDYGPAPVAGIWAGSQKLQEESEKIAGLDDDGEAETDDDSADEEEKDREENGADDDRTSKKVRVE